MVEAYRNQFGRKPGRGWRPWLILPKSLAVSLFVGGLVATAVFFHGIRLPENATPALQDLRRLAMLRTLFLTTVVPGASACLLLGLLLTLGHGRAFIRLRWWQIKTAMAIVGMAGAHFWMASRLEMLADAWRRERVAQDIQNQLAVGFVVVGLLAVALVWLGRIKPNFRQNWARSAPPSESPSIKEPS